MCVCAAFLCSTGLSELEEGVQFFIFPEGFFFSKIINDIWVRDSSHMVSAAVSMYVAHMHVVNCNFSCCFFYNRVKAGCSGLDSLSSLSPLLFLISLHVKMCDFVFVLLGNCVDCNWVTVRSKLLYPFHAGFSSVFVYEKLCLYCFSFVNAPLCGALFVSTVSRNNRKWFDLWPRPMLQPRLSLSCICFLFSETSEDDEDDNEEESDSDDGGCEESGLGLLARFAASALPVSSTPLSLLHDGKHRSRQSTLGKNTTNTNKLCVSLYKKPEQTWVWIYLFVESRKIRKSWENEVIFFSLLCWEKLQTDCFLCKLLFLLISQVPPTLFHTIIVFFCGWAGSLLEHLFGIMLLIHG